MMLRLFLAVLAVLATIPAVAAPPLCGGLSLDGPMRGAPVHGAMVSPAMAHHAMTPTTTMPTMARHDKAPHAMARTGSGPGIPPIPTHHQTAPDGCIGCIVPGTARAPRILSPMRATAPLPPGFALTGAALAAGPPATPPPRPIA